MGKVLKYLKPYWLVTILSPLFMCGEVWVDLKLPQLMIYIINDGIGKGDMRTIGIYGLQMVLYAILGGICGVASAGFGSASSQFFANDLRCDAFSRVMLMSPQQTDKFTTGSLVTRITNDISQVQNFVAMALRGCVRTVLLFGGSIYYALQLNVKFGVVVLVSLPIQLAIVVFFMTKASPLFGIVQEKLDCVNSVVRENITGARVVKAYVREEHEIDRFGTANKELCDMTFKVSKIMATMMPLVMIVMNLTIISIIRVGGGLVDAGSMQAGEVMAAITYVTHILMSIMMISMMFQMISRAMASAKRIEEVLDTHPVIEGGSEELCGDIEKIEFRDVSFSYPGSGGRPVLCGVNLEINKGETVAILGSTGAGKTSLVSLIARYYDANDGEILVNGRNIKDFTLESLRKKVGYVLQKSELFSGTIADNIRWGNPDATDEEVRECAKTAQADEFITSFNNGYDTVIGEKGASLSGGQKQRLSIARSVMKRPEVLIFDDSTSALDLGTEARLQKALRENLAGTTVILIAQRIASVMNADRIIVLDKGEIAACGTHDELLKGSAVYRDIYDSQMRKEDGSDE